MAGVRGVVRVGSGNETSSCWTHRAHLGEALSKKNCTRSGQHRTSPRQSPHHRILSISLLTTLCWTYSMKCRSLPYTQGSDNLIKGKKWAWWPRTRPPEKKWICFSPGLWGASSGSSTRPPCPQQHVMVPSASVLPALLGIMRTEPFSWEWLSSLCWPGVLGLCDFSVIS